MSQLSSLKALLKRIPPFRGWANPVASDSTLAEIAESICRVLDRPGAEQELFTRLRARGVYLLRDHYYRPLIDPAKLPRDYFSSTSPMVGIPIDPARCLELAEKTLGEYIRELRSFLPVDAERNGEDLHLNNGTYMAVDAHIYYALLRHLQPSKIYEIGAGNSTLFAYEALKRGGGLKRSELTVIEPFPDQIVKRGLSSVARVKQAFVQDVEIEFFDRLGDGDILFIDSTHTLREGGDVQYLYCEVLPRLSSGVYVHVHDISLPERYPRCYLDHGWFWNEQYLLQAYLTHNDRAEVVWPGNYLMCKEPDRMLKLFPEIAAMRAVYPESEPTAFWFRVR
jgi:hypothetical protein